MEKNGSFTMEKILKTSENIGFFRDLTSLLNQHHGIPRLLLPQFVS